MADITVSYIFILAMKSYPAAKGALDPMAMLIRLRVPCVCGAATSGLRSTPLMYL
jgi:hypothetical protein